MNFKKFQILACGLAVCALVSCGGNDKKENNENANDSAQDTEQVGAENPDGQVDISITEVTKGEEGTPTDGDNNEGTTTDGDDNEGTTTDGDNNEGTTTDNATASTSTSSDNNWDEFLAEYEKYIDELVELYKANDPLTVATEAAKINAQMAETYQKLEKAKSDLTPAQAKKLTDLAAKAAQAAQAALK